MGRCLSQPCCRRISLSRARPPAEGLSERVTLVRRGRPARAPGAATRLESRHTVRSAVANTFRLPTPKTSPGPLKPLYFVPGEHCSGPDPSIVCWSCMSYAAFLHCVYQNKAVKGPRYLSRLHARACAPNLAFHLWGNVCVWKRVWVERKALLLDHKVRAFLAALGRA